MNRSRDRISLNYGPKIDVGGRLAQLCSRNRFRRAVIGRDVAEIEVVCSPVDRAFLPLGERGDQSPLDTFLTPRIFLSWGARGGPTRNENPSIGVAEHHSVWVVPKKETHGGSRGVLAFGSRYITAHLRTKRNLCSLFARCSGDGRFFFWGSRATDHPSTHS